MEINLLKEDVMTENFAGIETVTRKMARKRALELAHINNSQNLSKSDWEQARQELTGEPDTNSNETILESAPESERWDLVPSSNEHKTSISSNDDEDEEGRSESERLVEGGIKEAQHDQMLQAAKSQRLEDQQP